jgi:hypothetical protein
LTINNNNPEEAAREALPRLRPYRGNQRVCDGFTCVAELSAPLDCSSVFSAGGCWNPQAAEGNEGERSPEVRQIAEDVGDQYLQRADE